VRQAAADAYGDDSSILRNLRRLEKSDVLALSRLAAAQRLHGLGQTAGIECRLVPRLPPCRTCRKPAGRCEQRQQCRPATRLQNLSTSWIHRPAAPNIPCREAAMVCQTSPIAPAIRCRAAESIANRASPAGPTCETRIGRREKSVQRRDREEAQHD